MPPASSPQRTPYPAQPELQVSPDDPSLYINRELSLLAFQRRVLEEAEDPRNPLLERVKFLSILGSNLDEFFMVRVAGLKDQVEAGVPEVGPDGMRPKAQLEAVCTQATELVARANACFRDELTPALRQAGIDLVNYASLSLEQRAEVNAYFLATVLPVLTPLAFDPGRPFPHISNRSLNLAVLIRDAIGIEHFARLKVPDTLPQLVPVGEKGFLWLEDVIAANLPALFPGMAILESHPFHVTRDADLEIAELEAEDLLETIEESVKQRRFGSVVRLTVSEAMPSRLLEILVSNLEIEAADVYRVSGPLDLNRLGHVYGLDRPELKDAPFVPRLPDALVSKPDDEDLFAVMRRENILLHHPYDTYQPVVDFLRKAAHDPNVLAIKMTLYRVGRNSPVVKALLEAIAQNKQVAVLVELKARFDEESNIEWARALESEGAHVVYGLVGLKIHAKVAMVVRREGEAIQRYVHLATGNYNVTTARLYTDLGLLTCDEQIGRDVTDLFNYLTGYSAKTDYRKLFVAPVNLAQHLAALIEREIEHARGGAPARLIFKMNSLVDAKMIRLLYEASRAGVQVDLLVRGVCCLRPGLEGVSDRIRVISIVGRFLEHSRIYYFHNAGREEVYLGSADLMPRNLYRRVEVLFPVEDAAHVQYLRDNVLATYLADTEKARLMAPDGTYTRAQTENSTSMNSQEVLLAAAPQRHA